MGAMGEKMDFFNLLQNTALTFPFKAVQPRELELLSQLLLPIPSSDYFHKLQVCLTCGMMTQLLKENILGLIIFRSRRQQGKSTFNQGSGNPKVREKGTGISDLLTPSAELQLEVSHGHLHLSVQNLVQVLHWDNTFGSPRCSCLYFKGFQYTEFRRILRKEQRSTKKNPRY